MELSLLSSLPVDCSTRDVARVLGMAVRSVQLMVDRGELEAWKTPGGHRRIAKASVERWLAQRQGQGQPVVPVAEVAVSGAVVAPDDGVVKAAPRRAEQVSASREPPGTHGQRGVLIVDILLPGIDGATLIARLRSHPQFQRSRLIVVTSLDEEQRSPYAFALAGLPVVHKPRLVQVLPALLAGFLRPVAEKA